MKKKNPIRILLLLTALLSMLFMTAYAEHCITYEAENAALSGLCSVTEKTGLSGGKNVGTIDYNPGGQESTVTFTVSVIKDGDYTVYVHASGLIDTFPNPAHDYYINGDSENRQTINYTQASVWEAPNAYPITVSLKKGINTISFTYHYPGEPWWYSCAELDCIRVAMAEDSLLPIALEAEDCYLTGAAAAITSVGAHDNAKVGFVALPTDTINFKITAPQDGEYLAFLRASSANGSVGSPAHAVYVNGDEANKTIVSYPGTRGWDDFSDYPVLLSLKTGENTVTVAGTGETNANSDLDRIAVFMPGTWATAQPEGYITPTHVYDLPCSTYTFDGTIYLASNNAVGGLALMNADNTVGYFLEANAPEHMFKLFRGAKNADGSWGVTMMGYKQYSKLKWAANAKLRLEANGNQLRAYYLNEVGGEAPWAEFDFDVAELNAMTQASTFVVGGLTSVLSTSMSDKSFTLSLATFKNPVIYNLADPDVIYENGVYYAYGTHDTTSFDVFKSTDLVHWTKKEDILANPVPWSGANVNFWAPGVAKIDGKFYLAGSINENIGFFVSDSPEGPFHLIGSGPVFRRSIDANIFIDDDGRVYVYYVSWDSGVYGIYGVEYNRTLTTQLSGITHILSPDSAWEMHEGAVTEGPFMLKHNGLYYLTYSGSNYESDHYAIGYATLTSPLGSAQKYADNPVFRRTIDIAGTAHHGFVKSPNGELFLIYHAHESVNNIHPRNMCIGRARFVKDVGGKPDYLELGSPIVATQDQPITECPIVFQPGDGTGTMQADKATTNWFYQLPSSGFTRPGYVQTGWTLWRPYTWESLFVHNGNLAWYWQGQEPEGATLAVVEPDGLSFVPVHGGESLYFFAQWHEGEVYYDTTKEKVYVRLPQDVEKGRVWYAVYEGDTLVSVESLEITGTVGQTAHGELKNPKTGSQKAFLFTWDSGFMPLHDKKAVE